MLQTWGGGRGVVQLPPESQAPAPQAWTWSPRPPSLQCLPCLLLSSSIPRAIGPPGLWALCSVPQALLPHLPGSSILALMTPGRPYHQCFITSGY